MSILPLCLRPWTSFEIDDGRDCWGRAQPCCWTPRHMSAGATGSFNEIWNGRAYVEFRKHMLEGDLEGYCPNDCPNLMSSSKDRSLYLRQMLRNPKPNHILNMLEILRGATVLHSKPVYVKVTPNLDCNLRCIMCYQSHGTKQGLPDQTVESILDILPQAQLLRVQGGEVFASDAGLGFLERVAALEQSPDVGIVTNGTFPNGRGWDVLDRLSLRWVIVSVDAASPQVYREIRIGGDWHAVIANVERLCAQRHAPSRGFEVYLSCTLMTLNYDQLRPLLELAHKLGADVVLNPLTPDSNTRHLDVIDQPRFHAAARASLVDAMAYASRAGMALAQRTTQGMLDLLDASEAK